MASIYITLMAVVCFAAGFLLRGVLRPSVPALPAPEPGAPVVAIAPEVSSELREKARRAHVRAQELEGRLRDQRLELERARDEVVSLKRVVRKDALVIQSLESTSRSTPADLTAVRAWHAERKLVSLEQRLASRNQEAQQIDRELDRARWMLAQTLKDRQSAEEHARELLEDAARRREQLDRRMAERSTEWVQRRAVKQTGLEQGRRATSWDPPQPVRSGGPEASPVQRLAYELSRLVHGSRDGLVVLADAAGVLVAGVGDREQQHTMAALSSVATHFGELVREQSGLGDLLGIELRDVDGHTMRLRRFEWSGQSVALVTFVRGTLRGLADEDAAVRRIVGLLDGTG